MSVLNHMLMDTSIKHWSQLLTPPQPLPYSILCRINGRGHNDSDEGGEEDETRDLLCCQGTETTLLCALIRTSPLQIRMDMVELLT